MSIIFQCYWFFRVINAALLMCTPYCVLSFSGTGVSLSVLAVGFLLSAQASPPVNLHPTDPTSLNSTCTHYRSVSSPYFMLTSTVWTCVSTMSVVFSNLLEYNNMDGSLSHTFPDFVSSACWIQTVAFVTTRMAQTYQTLPVSESIRPTLS